MARRAGPAHPARATALFPVAAYAVFTTVLLAVGWGLVRGPLVVSDWIQSADQAVTDWVVEQRTPMLDAVAETGSSLADTWMVIGLSIGSLTVLLVLRRWSYVTIVAVGVTLELAVFVTVSFAVDRPRPDAAMGDIPVTGSFPSGHAAISIALWGGLAVVVRAAERRRAWPATAAAVVASGVATVVGLSRVYGGLHFLSDVVMGWLLGLACLAVGVITGRLVAMAVDGRWPGRQLPAPPPDRTVASCMDSASAAAHHARHGAADP